MSRDDMPDLGPCCCCGGSRKVRNLVMLPRRCSVPGTGWGCVVCGLPADGASYVCCDRCLKADVPPREVIRGYPNDRGREPIEALSPEPFEHDFKMHYERGDGGLYHG